MKRHQKHVKVDIRRAGQLADILRPSGGTENGYGKVSDSNQTFSKISETYAVIDMEHGEKFRPENVTGGTRDLNRPEYRVPHDVDVQDGDRLRIEGIQYEIENIAPYPTHKVLKTVMING
jgi:hypothetical protein